MASVRSQAGGLASSDDGRWLVWSEPHRIVLADLQKHAQVAELALDLEPPVALAMCTNPDRVLIVQQRRGTTRVRVLSVPELKPLAEGVLEREARLVAVCGVTAVLLGGADSLTALDLGDLHATTMTVRGPIQLVAPYSQNQILITARGKVETWSLEERRPTHRLSLVLPKNPGFAGTAANGTLLWAASADAPGAVTAFRLAEGTQLQDSTLDGTPLAVLSHPTTQTLVAVVQRASGTTELVALDLARSHTRVLPCEAAISAACVIGAPADAVAVLPDHGAAFLVPLAAGPIRTIAIPQSGAVLAAATDEPGQSAPAIAPNVAADRLDEWRAQVQAAVHSQTPAQAAITTRIIRTEEPTSRTRAELYAWGEAVRARRSSAPPPPPQVWRLTELAQRFDLDLRSRSLLALLYASWLDGEGRTGMPVGHIARALGNDEQSWIEALAQGRLGRLGWIRSDHGRTRLRTTIGRFLDEAKPRITLIAPTGEAPATLEPPIAPAVWRDGGLTDEHARELASACRIPIARIDLDELPATRLARVLDERIFEARLHGALPMLVARDVSSIDVAKLSGSLLLALRGPAPAAWQALPLWPPVREAAEASAS